jgi:beta-galactosidase
MRAYSCTISSSAADAITVTVNYSLGAPALSPVLGGTLTYTFFARGGVRIDCDVTVRGMREGLALPRFGFVLQTPEGFEQLRYFGRGPVSSYVDMHHASRLDEFSTTVSEHFEHFIRPQENMAHNGCKWLLLSNTEGIGLLAASTVRDFSFNCSHFTDEQLTQTPHDFELTPLKQTVLHLDYRHNGIGSNSCGPALRERFALLERSFSHSVRLLPTRTCAVDPYSEIGKQ